MPHVSCKIVPQHWASTLTYSTITHEFWSSPVLFFCFEFWIQKIEEIFFSASCYFLYFFNYALDFKVPMQIFVSRKYSQFPLVLCFETLYHFYSSLYTLTIVYHTFTFVLRFVYIRESYHEDIPKSSKFFKLGVQFLSSFH